MFSKTDGHLVHGLATVSGVVVLGGGNEGVHVAALTAGSRVGKIDLKK